MRRALRSGVVTVLCLAVVGSVAVATSASGSGENRTLVLHLSAREVSSVYLPVEPDRVSQGDEFHFANDLFRRSGRGETKVGEDGGLCTVSRHVAGGSTSYHCAGTNDLPGGQIATQGLVTYGADEEVKATPYSFSITGGTGRYRTARGEVSIKELSRQHFLLTFRIVL
jgi:hypothetical protein